MNWRRTPRETLVQEPEKSDGESESPSFWDKKGMVGGVGGEYVSVMGTVQLSSKISATPLKAALGCVVEGVELSGLSDSALAEVGEALLPMWDEHLVLFFPGLSPSPADQVRFAKCFGNHFAATTDAGGDNRSAPSLADEGFPEILVLDTANERFDPRVTANWHTDVTFAANPPKASLFCMEIAAVNGGNTMWSSQISAHSALSQSFKDLIADKKAVHGRPPLTNTNVHPMVRDHHATGKRALFVNRGWTNSIVGLTSAESRHVLDALFETAEKPEHQIRWVWTSGDVALWDNRYTMHYALNDYAGQRRRARRVTIYDI